MAKLEGLCVSDDLTLPIEIVTQTQVILAKKGAGKTYTAAVEIEEALKLKQQIVVLDPTGAWWGLKASADGEKAGFPIAIFGGEHADIPLEESAGEVVATAIVERQFSAVIDLSLFRKGQMHRFLVPFLETLYRINRHSLLLVVDEADFAAPQKPFGEEARTLGAMQDIVRRGRIRGTGLRDDHAAAAGAEQGCADAGRHAGRTADESSQGSRCREGMGRRARGSEDGEGDDPVAAVAADWHRLVLGAGFGPTAEDEGAPARHVRYVGDTKARATGKGTEGAGDG